MFGAKQLEEPLLIFFLLQVQTFIVNVLLWSALEEVSHCCTMRMEDDVQTFIVNVLLWSALEEVGHCCTR